MATWDEIKEMLEMLKGDSATPKGLREKLNSMVAFINTDKDSQLKINQLQQELEDISNDVNLPPFIRTQLWAISSALETIDD